MARLAILDGYQKEKNSLYDELSESDKSEIELPAQSVHSQHEYTIISQTDETIFVEDETGAPHVFTIEEWNAIKGKKNDGTGFLLVAAIAAGLMIL